MNATDMATAALVGMIEQQWAHAMHLVYWIIAAWLVVVLIGLSVSERRHARRIARTDRDLRRGLGDLSILRRR